MTDDDRPAQFDPLGLFEALEPMLAQLRGLVATFVNEGFSEPQARDLAVFVMKQTGAQR